MSVDWLEHNVDFLQVTIFSHIRMFAIRPSSFFIAGRQEVDVYVVVGILPPIAPIGNDFIDTAGFGLNHIDCIQPWKWKTPSLQRLEERYQRSCAIAQPSGHCLRDNVAEHDEPYIVI